MPDTYKTFIRFCSVGLFATILHIGVASVTAFIFGMSVYLSSLVAYLVATVVTFLANAYWSFNTRPDKKNALRFLLLCVFNILFIKDFSIIVVRLNINTIWALIIIAGLISFVNFLVLSKWVFIKKVFLKSSAID